MIKTATDQALQRTVIIADQPTTTGLQGEQDLEAAKTEPVKASEAVIADAYGNGSIRESTAIQVLASGAPAPGGADPYAGWLARADRATQASYNLATAMMRQGRNAEAAAALRQLCLKPDGTARAIPALFARYAEACRGAYLQLQQAERPDQLSLSLHPQQGPQVQSLALTSLWESASCYRHALELLEAGDASLSPAQLEALRTQAAAGLIQAMADYKGYAMQLWDAVLKPSRQHLRQQAVAQGLLDPAQASAQGNAPELGDRLFGAFGAEIDGLHQQRAQLGLSHDGMSFVWTSWLVQEMLRANSQLFRDAQLNQPLVQRLSGCVGVEAVDAAAHIPEGLLAFAQDNKMI